MSLKALAEGLAGADAPPGYVAALNRLEAIVRAFVQSGGETPRFAMPPRVVIAAGLDQIGERLARNESARALIELACACELKEMPTPTMLRIALDANGIVIEECTLAELGLEIQSMPSRGGDA